MARRTTVANVERMRAKIADLQTEAREAMRAALEKSGEEIVALAQRNVPVGDPKEGHIRDSIRMEDGRTDLTVNVVYGDENHVYAAPLEFGHMVGETHVAPVPVFFPAVKVVRRKHRSRMNRAMNKVIKDITSGPKT